MVHSHGSHSPPVPHVDALLQAFSGPSFLQGRDLEQGGQRDELQLPSLQLILELQLVLHVSLLHDL